MEYRACRPDEIQQQLRRAAEYCFFVEPRENDGYIENRVKPECTRALFDNEGQLKAGLVNFPLELYMGGAKLRMGAVAGVVSWPESRREGYVGDLLVRLLAEERERGVPLSGLYPFKQSFYRRFGWEVAAAWVSHTVPLDLLGHHRGRPGVVQRFAPGQADWRLLEALYAARYAAEWGYVVRETDDYWANWGNPEWNPPAMQLHTAIWRPTRTAEPEGYLLYRFAKDDQGHMLLAVKELVAVTPAAEQGLWGYIAQHDSQVRAVRFRTLRDYPLWHLVENKREVKSALDSGAMLRFVDLKPAFEQRPWPGTPNGALTLTVTDEHAPWNQGTWKVAFETGRATVSAVPAATSQLSVDITTLAQLYAGFVRPDQAAWSGRLQCSDPKALRLLAAATAGKELWYYEFY